MNEIIFIFLSFLLGALSGFLGGIATGAGFIAIPGMIMLGLSPSTAIATNNLTVASSISSAFRYHQSKLIKYHSLFPLMCLSFIGGLVGPLLLIQINAELMQRFFGVICLVMAITISKNDYNTFKAEGSINKFKGGASIFVASALAGLFGTGGGILTIFALLQFYKMSITAANASSKIIGLTGTISTLLVFLQTGLINFQVGIPLMIGSAFGGYAGAHTAIKKGDKRVKKIFLALIIILGVKMLIF